MEKIFIQMMQINFMTIAIAYLIINISIFKNKKDWLFFLMMIFLLTVIPVSYMFGENLLLFFVLFVWTIHVQKNETIFLSLIRVIYPFIIVLVLSIFDDLFFRSILHFKINIETALIISNVLFFLVIYLIGRVVNKRIIPLIIVKQKEKSVAIMLLIVYSLCQSVFVYLFFSEDIYQRTMSVIVTFTFFLLLYLFVQSVSDNSRLRLEMEKQRIENRFMNEYAKEAINQEQEIRKFKHDYINILSSLAYFIQTNDMDKLSDYYQKNIQRTQTVLEEGIFNLRELENIHSEEIKSIIAVKLLLAKEKKITVGLEVPDYLPQSFLVNTLTLVRMLGIILDNSIEATSQIDNATIDIGLFDLETHYLFVVKNSVKEKIPPLYQLEKEGCSTKGEDRGLGLSNLKKLSQKEKYLTLETRIEQTSFIQKITIRKAI